MKVLPIRYSADVEASIRFYRALGLELGAVSRPGAWAELPAAGGVLAVHAAPDAVHAGTCELAFEADEPLEDIAKRVRDNGFEPEPILDENFGRLIRVRDPDGVVVQINEHDPSLYT